MRQFTLTSSNGNTRTVTDFPWIAKQTPCPWNDSKYARVMIPFTDAEQSKHKHAKQHIQIVNRNRLSVIKPNLAQVS